MRVSFLLQYKCLATLRKSSYMMSVGFSIRLYFLYCLFLLLTLLDKGFPPFFPDITILCHVWLNQLINSIPPSPFCSAASPFRWVRVLFTILSVTHTVMRQQFESDQLMWRKRFQQTKNYFLSKP